MLAVKVTAIHPRYSRQALYEPIGPSGQALLARARVVIVGCGALGSVSASTLARAGVGHLTIVDRDFVEESNLQRQVLFDEADAREALPKAVAASRRLARINSTIEVTGIVADVNPANVESLLDRADLVLDGTDNFETRFLVNDACLAHGRPWIYGACIGSFGLMMPVLPGETPCLRCVVPSAPPGSNPTGDTTGIIGPIVNIVSSMQCAEALKLLTGQRDLVVGDLVAVDAWDLGLQRLRTRPLRDLGECPCCNQRRFDYLSAARASQTTTLCGRESVQISFPDGHEVDFDAISGRLAALTAVQRNAFLLRCRLDRYDLTLFRDGRAIIDGTCDTSVARSLYARYIGV
jgi:molybdopterin/thiamine biosynthesis adenylyltransferase